MLKKVQTCLQSSVLTTLAVLALSTSVAYAETIEAKAKDGGIVYGETYYGELPATSPVVALFHQAGGDGRGEYAPLVSWLNEQGLRAIAWDLRSGGDRFGQENRTAANYDQEKLGYCNALPDIHGALKFSVKEAGGKPVAIWGSSYSAALVFRAGAHHPKEVAAVIAASPASGEPMADCSVESVLEDVDVPVLALRPRREMEFTKEQAERLKAADIDFYVVENGVHGTSMLVDERTKNDMSADRAFVAEWLLSHLSEMAE